MFFLFFILLPFMLIAFGLANFARERKKLPPFRKLEMKGTVAFVFSIFFCVFNRPTIGIPLFLLSLWIASQSRGLNIRGIVYQVKALPAILSKNRAKVISICDDALKGDTRAPALFSIGAEYAINLNQFDKSLAFCDRVILLSFDDSRGYLLRGITNFHLNKFEDSLRDLNKAIELDPKHDNSLKLERARTQLALSNFESALQDLENCSASPLIKKEIQSDIDSLRSSCNLALAKTKDI